MDESKQDLLILQAQQALDQENWLEALSVYEELYQIEQSADVNRQLVNLTVRLEQFQLGEQYLLDNVDAYLDNKDDIDNLILIFMRNQNYIMCREIINRINNLSLYQYANDLVTKEEEKARQILSGTFKTRMREFKYLGLHKFAQQYQGYQTGLQLPLKEHVAIARTLLIDEDVSELVRITILASFVSLKITGEVDFLWLDQKLYTRDLTDTVPSLATKTAFVIQDTLYDELEDSDPVTLVALEQNIILRIRASFPFIDEVITDPVNWTKYQIARFRGDMLPELNENDIKWLIKFDELFAKIGN